MPTRLWVLIAAAVVALSVGMVDPCYATFAGGSRLIYYYRETSFSPGGSGLTLFTVINNDRLNPVTVRFAIFNGANCNSAGPFNTTLGAREAKTIAVTDFAPAATFPSGFIDLWAVNGFNLPIR